MRSKSYSCNVMCNTSQIPTRNSSNMNPKQCINEPGWEPKSRREKKHVCRNGVSRVNFSKYTQNGPSILASASLVYHMIANSENTWSFDYFWHSVGLQVFRSEGLLNLLSLISQDFLLLSCLDVRSRNALLNMLDGYNHEFWMTSRYSLKYVLELFASTSIFTRESSFKGIPLEWAIANVFEDLDFLSHNYCEQNKTARSEINQRHRHLNLPLDQKLHFRHITILK